MKGPKNVLSLAGPGGLSREMRVLLVLLLMVGLIGGWYVWTGSRNAQAAQNVPASTPAAASTPSGSAATPTPQEDRVPVAATPGAGEGLSVQPNGQVDVPSIPAFGEPPAAAAAPAEATPAPGGINPDIPLAALPSTNPFRPLAVVGAEGAAPAAPTATTSPAPAPVPTAGVAPVPRPASSFGGEGGALSLAPIPGAQTGTVQRPAVETTTGGAIPLPPIPGANGETGTTPPVLTLTHPPKVTPRPTVLPTIPLPGGAAGGDRPAAPVRPPVAGVRVPSGGINLGGLIGQAPAASAGKTQAPAAGAAALPAPGLPQPITQLGGDGADQTPTSPLGRFVQGRALAFDAAVLGPVNTAVFRSKDGFVVVSVGQTLPNSEVTLTQVTAAGATLALGTETQTLNLDDPTKGEP